MDSQESLRADGAPEAQGPHAAPRHELEPEDLDGVSGGSDFGRTLTVLGVGNSTVPEGAVVTPYPTGWIPGTPLTPADTPTGLPPMLPEGGPPPGF